MGSSRSTSTSLPTLGIIIFFSYFTDFEIVSYFFFFFLEVLGFEFRAACLLGRYLSLEPLYQPCHFVLHFLTIKNIEHLKKKRKCAIYIQWNFI
jgi:hypothetical protein